MDKNETQYLTTGEDIRKLLSKCDTCYSITNNGNYVIFHTKLPQIILPFNKVKIGLIVNTASTEKVLGHWFTLNLYLSSGLNKNRYCYCCDGLNQVRKEPHVLKNIKIFCRNNNVTFSWYPIRLQRVRSLRCGYIAIWFIYQLSILSLRSFIELRKILSRHSLHFNEKRVLTGVKKHFQINSL